MRVWCVNPSELCPQRLLAQHNEIHAILEMQKHNWSKHGPKPFKWDILQGNVGALLFQDFHQIVVGEMCARGFPSGSDHQTPFDWGDWYDHACGPFSIVVSGIKMTWTDLLQSYDFLSDERLIRDVRDLQNRWTTEIGQGKKKQEWLDKSIIEHGDYRDGSPR